MGENSSMATTISVKTHLRCGKVCVKLASESHWVNALQELVFAK